MSSPLWKVKPPLGVTGGRLWVGPATTSLSGGVLLGRLAEASPGKSPQVWLGTRKEQVVAVVGKRGSGKSFTLGVIAEGLSVQGEGESIAIDRPARAVLIFDPLDVYWTTRFPIGDVENLEARRHFRLAEGWGVTGLHFDVEAWVPGTDNQRSTDPPWFRSLQLPVSELGVEEWELFLDTNVLRDPMGQALGDCIDLVSRTGYRLHQKAISPISPFDIPDLMRAANSHEATGTYHPETLRALVQRLRSLNRTGLFSATGTSIAELLSPGRSSVILLNRLSQTHRVAVVAAMTRMLMNLRSQGAFAEKRLALDPSLSAGERASLEDRVLGGVPKTIIVLDEAQTFLTTGESSVTRNVFVKVAKEGRNIGLSFVLATQQPSAVDQRVLSQVETFISHQLVTEADISAVRSNLKAALPAKIEFGPQEMSFSDMLRGLQPGQCFVSSGDIGASYNRGFVLNIRARSTVHGGIEL